MIQRIVPATGRNGASGALETSPDGIGSEASTAGLKPGEASGLVISAKTAQPVIPDDLSSLLELHFRFPSGDAVRVAAEAFPVESRTGRAKTAAPVPGRGTGPEHRTLETDEYGMPFYRQLPVTNHRVVNESAEGPWPTIEIAPGLVRLRRVDPAKRARAQEQAVRRGMVERDQGARLAHQEFDFNEGYWNESLDGQTVTVGRVVSWSQRSQVRMQSTIRELDLYAFLQGRTPAMLTLTLPGPWLAIMPDAATASARFRRFRESYRKMWGNAVWLWKREFQRRGAPHWHLWMVPPIAPLVGAHSTLADRVEHMPPTFRDWVRYAWAAALDLTPALGHFPQPETFTDCHCGDAGNRPVACKSLSAGTNVDFAEGARASDPQRLATYFLKESAGSTGKQYQNSVPWAWCVGGVDVSGGELGPLPKEKIPRASVGRFWGRSAGLEKVLASVSVAPDTAVKLWRSMRKAQNGRRLAWKNTTVGVVVRTGISGGVAKPTKVIRSRPVDVDPGTGEVGTVQLRRRPVARVRKLGASAGWVGVNDGPAFGVQLARYLSGEPNWDRPPVPAPMPGSKRDYLARKYAAKL